jgi:two-component system LytT family sensor kinase
MSSSYLAGMIKRVFASTLLRYALASSCLFLFWFAYYFFNSKVLSRSALLAGIDTVEYMGGYLIVSYFLLPRFILHKNIFYFIAGLMLLVLLIGAMRIYEYEIVSAMYHQPYTVTTSSLIYVFTTTTFILGALSGVRFTIDWLQSQKRIEEINKERATSELEFLKAQLNPHFFFNSINTLYGSIDADNEKARSILIKLSDMLRYQLYECATDHVPLEKEVNYIRNFVDLQQLRTNERLHVTLAIDEKISPFSVPPLLLAPLVENAFKHISKFTLEENWIAITLVLIQGRIHFTIQNSFEKNENQHPVASGIGLTNIQRRLELIYGAKAELKIERKSPVFTVNLYLPTV